VIRAAQCDSALSAQLAFMAADAMLAILFEEFSHAA